MEVRLEPVRTGRRVPVQVLIAVVLLALTAVTVGAALAGPGALVPRPVSAGIGAAAAPSADPSASAGTHDQARQGFAGRAFGFAWGAASTPNTMGAGGGMSGGFLPDIKITAISGMQVSLASANGWTRTIDVTGVTITRAGSTIAAGDLHVGDRVEVREKRSTAGTYTVTGLVVVVDQLGGTVTKIDGAAITVARGGKKTGTITTDGSTVYRRAGQTVSRSDLAVGERIMAFGTADSAGVLAASSVEIQPDVVIGTVTKISGSTLTIGTYGGGTATVQVTSTTKVTVVGKTTATIADIEVKDSIVALGVKGSGGVLVATEVRVGGLRVAMPNGQPAMPGGQPWRGINPPLSSGGSTGTSG